MNAELQNQLFQTAPILYAIAQKSPAWKIGASDDLFPFLNELSLEIEKFNMRYRKRAVRVMKIAMVGGELVFLVNRQIPAIEKKIISARYRIRLYRNALFPVWVDKAKLRSKSLLLDGKSE